MTTESYKVCVLGGGAVGKSSLTVQYLKGIFKDKYNPTIEDSFIKKTEVDGRVVTLNILDTAGQEEYTCLRDQYLRDSQGFVMVFSLIDASSFYEIEEIFEQLMTSKEEEEGELSVVLVGNKCDLPERVVKLEDIDALVERLYGKENGPSRRIQYVESSAKDNVNVDEAFAHLVRLFRSDIKDEVKPGSKVEKRSTKKKRTRFSLGSLCSREDQERDLDMIV